jgi:hypothetical protein
MLPIVFWLIILILAPLAAVGALLLVRRRPAARRVVPETPERLPPPEVREALLRRSVPVLYFTEAGAADVRRLQDPAVFMLNAEFEGRVTVIRCDVVEHAALARQFAVTAAPATIVFDHRGRIAAVNRGYVRLDELRQQVLRARSLEWAMGG